MVEASEATGTPLYVAHVVRFFPEYSHLHSLVEKGAIGRPGVYRSSRNGVFPQWGGWFADEAESGGVILDVMIHDFDFARWCCGDVTRIFVRRRRWAGPPNGEHAFALLRFAYRDAEDLERFHTEVLMRLPGVARSNSMLVLRTVKKTTALAL